MSSRVNFAELFNYNSDRAAHDLSNFVQGKMSLNSMRGRWPHGPRSAIYKMERVGVERARRSAYGALRSRGYVAV